MTKEKQLEIELKLIIDKLEQVKTSSGYHKELHRHIISQDDWSSLIKQVNQAKRLFKPKIKET